MASSSLTELKIASAKLSDLQLLSTQSFLNGIGFAILTAVGHAVFLAEFGAEWLPYVFIAVAVLAPVLSFVFDSIERNVSVRLLVCTTMLFLTSLFFVWWGLLEYTAVKWVPFAIILFFYLLDPYTVVVSGIQSSLLFTLREMKDKAPIIMALEMSGIILVGLSMRVLLQAFGSETNLLLLGGSAAALQVILIIVTTGRRPKIFSEQKKKDLATEKPSANAFALLRKPFVRTAFIYQLLSEFGTQLTMYIYLFHAGRYFLNDSVGLTNFFGNFITVWPILSIVFLVLITPRLLKSWGLGAGLLANPLGVLLACAALLIAITFFPTELTMIFLLGVSIRLVDVIFTFSSTAISTTTIYQVIPVEDRVAAIGLINGVSIPLGNGLAGVVTLVFVSISVLTEAHLLLFTVLVCLLWSVLGLTTYRQYAATLKQRLTKRSIGTGETLDLTDPHALQIVTSFVEGHDLSQIRLALELLAKNAPDIYRVQLEKLLTHERIDVRLEAVSQIEALKLENVDDKLIQIVKWTKSPALKGAALRALLAISPIKHNGLVREHLHSPESVVRQSAMIALLRYGGIESNVVAGQLLLEIEKSKTVADQVLVAEVLAEIGDSNFFEPLLSRLRSPHNEVRQSALQAAGRLRHQRLLPDVIANLDMPAVRSAAVAALSNYGGRLVPMTRDALQNTWAFSPENRARFIRVIGLQDPTAAQRLLLPHICYEDDLVRATILRTLRTTGYQAEAAEIPTVNAALQVEIERAATILNLKHAVGTVPAFALLQDALDHNLEQAKVAVFTLLSFLYNSRTIWKAQGQLKSADVQELSMVLETLDVVLSSVHRKLIMPLIEPKMELGQRLAALDKLVAVESLSQDDGLRRIIGNWPDDWTRACAIRGVQLAKLNSLRLALNRVGAEDENSCSRETARAEIPHFQSNATKRQDTMLTIEKVALLRAASIFAETPNNVLASVAQVTKTIELKAEEQFITEGDTASEMYIILDGVVEARKNGKPIIRLSKGDTVGELAIFTGEMRSSDVVAVEPTLLFSIQREALQELMADRPEIAQGVISALSHRVQQQGALLATSTKNS